MPFHGNPDGAFLPPKLYVVLFFQISHCSCCVSKLRLPCSWTAPSGSLQAGGTFHTRPPLLPRWTPSKSFFHSVKVVLFLHEVQWRLPWKRGSPYSQGLHFRCTSSQSRSTLVRLSCRPHLPPMGFWLEFPGRCDRIFLAREKRPTNRCNYLIAFLSTSDQSRSCAFWVDLLRPLPSEPTAGPATPACWV